MGLLDDALKKLQQAASTAGSQAKSKGKGKDDGEARPWGGRRPDKASYGKAGAPTPDMDALVTDAEIEQITGVAPDAEPRRNGPDGSETDLGRHVIREWKLSNGDEFLISLGNCADLSAAQLSMDRLAEVEKAHEGVGERSFVRVKKYKSGKSEVGVTALQGTFTLALVHTSATGASDPGPVTELLKKALTRL